MTSGLRNSRSNMANAYAISFGDLLNLVSTIDTSDCLLASSLDIFLIIPGVLAYS